MNNKQYDEERREHEETFYEWEYKRQFYWNTLGQKYPSNS